jgi:hypothetical protein
MGRDADPLQVARPFRIAVFESEKAVHGAVRVIALAIEHPAPSATPAPARSPIAVVFGDDDASANKHGHAKRRHRYDVAKVT